MQNSRSAGVLLHITSLDGPFAVGVMGSHAKAFVQKIARMHFSYWQVLPLVPVDQSGSAYCSVSAFAGEPMLIDPQWLENEGFLTKNEVSDGIFNGTVYQTQFDFAREKRMKALRIAFSRIDHDTKAQCEIFAAQNSWVLDYAYFCALKDKYCQKPWWQWEKEYAVYQNAKKHREDFRSEIDFYVFAQYIFFVQWRSLKEYANEQGVKIIGDMPIYVSLDSADVWSNLELFEIDLDTLCPKQVAGVPPDYFSADGQLWGNPLYNWDKMKETGYRWWIDRLKHAMKMYDRVRIDHFRAFASYWAVPAESDTAKNGKWLKGPGMEFFNALKDEIGQADIIAEDLGHFGEDVVQLLSDSGFPGMRVVQFAFDSSRASTHLPHNYPKNCVAYVGTHDNNTLLGWLWEADKNEREYALRYCCYGGENWGEGGAKSGSCRAVIETVWRSGANTVIVSAQDMCGFGADARMNTPGTDKNNWSFRMSKEALNGIDEEYFKQINYIYSRD